MNDPNKARAHTSSIEERGSIDWYSRLLRRVSTAVVLFPAVALVLAAIWITVYSVIKLESGNAQRAGAQSSRELLRTYESQVIRALREIDQTLKLVKYAYESHDGRIALPELDQRELLPPDLLFTVGIADKNGKIVAATRPLGSDTVADDDIFREQAAADADTMSIGRSDPGRGSDGPMRFSRRLTSSDGQMTGIVIVAVDSSYFVSGYEDARLGKQGVLGLLGTDGMFRAGRRGADILSGQSVAYAAVVHDEPPDDAPTQTSTSLDATRRYTSSRELFEFPLAVVVGLSEDEQLAAARSNARVYVQRAALASALVILLGALLGRMSWQITQGRRRESEAKIAHAERVEYLAYHDSLTGLPNRSLFSKLLGSAIAQAQRHGRSLAVAFLDLDRFKQINDTLGHEAGDELLKEVAVRLKSCVRESDTVARLGGDEFVVLLPELSGPEHAATVARKILIATAQPFTVIGQEFRVTSSIGISTSPQDGVDEQTLTKNADIAMYQAKSEGKNNFQFYSAKLNVNSLERLSLESSLRHALERNEFQLYYQAKRGIATGQVTGMEALLRWVHPDLGVLGPSRFLPIAEETGLIIPIGKWVLTTACLQNLAWQRAGLPHLNIAVNLTARQFNDDHLLADLTAILEATGMAPGLLELELNEALLIRDVAKTLEILTRLKALGVKIAIDEFGTGYSSLATLQQFPLDTVKIDRSFIRGVADTNCADSLTDAVIAMGRSLSMTVVAQGVETREQADFLRAHACDELQGFYFTRPVPADEATLLLAAQAPEATYVGSRAALHDTL